MGPYVTDKSISLDASKELPKLKPPQADNWKFKISFINVAIIGYLHLAALYGLYLCFASAHWATVILALVLLEAGMLGLMAGCHRLWAHRSYKASLPLQLILMVFQSTTNQYTVLNWVRDHRLHHRYSDTDADPHNSARGLFFSHVGWLLVHKHPEVRRRGGSIDISDLMSSPVLVFQKKYGLFMVTLFAFVLPTLCPMFIWGETLQNAWHVNTLRIIICLNCVSLINSASHAFGNRPYDKEVRATENMVVNLGTLGEGFHNYHHVFPWDYRAAELVVSRFNLTAAFIEFFAWVGWAWDLKTVENGIVVKRAKRCGDGSFEKIIMRNDTVCDNNKLSI